MGTRLQHLPRSFEFEVGFPQDLEVLPGGPLGPQSTLPWETPWRIVVIGEDLATIVESTLGTDLAKPSVLADDSFVMPGRAAWSWALLKDNFVNYEVQRRFVDFAAEMGWEYCLVDVNWDTAIGYKRVAELVSHARDRGVGIFLWYNSSGDWNSTPYHPKGELLTQADRERVFSRLEEMGGPGPQNRGHMARVRHQRYRSGNGEGVGPSLHWFRRGGAGHRRPRAPQLPKRGDTPHVRQDRIGIHEKKRRVPAQGERDKHDRRLMRGRSACQMITGNSQTLPGSSATGSQTTRLFRGDSVVSTLVLASILQTTAVGLTGQGEPPAGQSQEAESRWVVTAPDSRARYRVREQLAGLDFPSDAVGETTAVTGTLVLGADGSVVAEESSFTVDLTTLKTDNDRRDGYVQGRTLETAEYPEATMVVQELRDLPVPLPTTGTHSFTIAGELTLHGVTRATVWEATADFGEEAITGQARTAFDFAAFDIAIPSVARVLSVADDIRLELDFRLTPG